MGKEAARTARRCAIGLSAMVVALCVGCGTTKSRTATEQLLMSEALDRAVSQIDFSQLSGHNVYFDTKFIVNTKDPMFIGNQKGLGFVNAEYVTSSLRQQMVAAGLKLQDKMEDADFVVEARLGAIGFDNNEVIYGIPASNPISAASAFMPNVPPVPAIPELSVARKNLNVGAAKVGVFAYDRKTREAVWQAGISQAASDSKDLWVMGVGPFQQGSIYKGRTQFAGSKLSIPQLAPAPAPEEELVEYDERVPVDEGSDPLERFSESRTFRNVSDRFGDSAVRPAAFVDPAGAQPIPKPAATPATTTAAGTPSPTPAAPPTTSTTAATTTTTPAANPMPPGAPPSK